MVSFKTVIMAFNGSQLDEIAAWCAGAPDLAADRSRARRQFFGEDDAQSVKYWPGAGDPTSRDRRFLGWFMFDFRMPDDRTPAEMGVEALLWGANAIEALDAVHRVRFLLAIVRSTDGRRSTFLELEDEHFEVRNSTWGQVMTRGSAVVAHLVPVRNRFWLPGPGWLEWPIGIGPNMRRELRKFQPDAVQIERLMQGRGSNSEEARTQEYPQDSTLEAAVARMTAAAREAGHAELVLSVEEWQAMVVRYITGANPNEYFQEVMSRLGSASDVKDLSRWLALANNIWNATPQPDRGGMTPFELSGLSDKRQR